MALHAGGQAGAQIVRCASLANPRNVVFLALDSQKRNVLNATGVNELTVHDHLSLGQAELLKDFFDRVDVIRRVQIQHCIVFVVESAVLLCTAFVALQKMIVEILVGARVAPRIHGHETKMLQKARVHPTTGARIADWHVIDDALLEPVQIVFHCIVVHRRGRQTRVDGPTNERHGQRTIGVRVAAACRHENRNHGLAHGHNVHALPNVVHELLDGVHVGA